MRACFYLPLLLVLALAAGCKKDLDGDFGGDGFLRGRLLYTDRFAGPGIPQPLANRQVRLAASPSDQLNFKYSVLTDKDGYFLFEHLRQGSAYDLFFADTLRRVRYTALQAALTPTTQPFNLLALNDTLTQNGVALTLSSSLLPASPVAGATLCVFTNRLLARADTCLNRLFELKTDEAGRAIRYGLSPGQYYFFGTSTLAGRPYRVLDSVQVPARGVARKALVLQPRSRLRTGFELTVLDRRATPLAGVRVCLFNSAVLARADTCAGSITQLTTDINGLARAYNLAPRRYYVRLRAAYGSLRLTGYDSLEVQANQVRVQTVHAQ